MAPKKAESEQAIRRLCHDWRRESGFSDTPPVQLSFNRFKDWMEEHHPGHFGFRSRAGADYDAEMWFDDEMKRNWTR